LQPPDTWGEYNQILFVVQQALSKMQTATLVRVDACTNEGALTAVGYVDVTPLVNQIDAAGSPTPHVTIYNIPYLRIQGGANAIILDPQVGDIGICVFASRDLSKVKATKGQANPGSLRQYSFSDGLYLGGALNGVPTQYVRFSTAGITVVSPALIRMEAPQVQIVAPLLEITSTTSVTITTPTFTVNGSSVLAGTITQTGGGAVSLSGDVTTPQDVTAGNISLKTHKTSGVTPGGGVSGNPIP
jgi:hypothetical protein